MRTINLTEKTVKLRHRSLHPQLQLNNLHPHLRLNSLLQPNNVLAKTDVEGCLTSPTLIGADLRKTALSKKSQALKSRKILMTVIRQQILISHPASAKSRMILRLLATCQINQLHSRLR